MYFSNLLCLLIVNYITFTNGFPFYMRTLPKTVARYQSIPIPAPIRTIPSLPLSHQWFQKRRTQIRPTSNKVDNVFADEQYFEQRKIDDREDFSSDDSSDLHPIYVLPPPNFQPIVYQTSRSDGVLSGPKGLADGGYVISGHTINEYPQGVSTWILGGLSGQKGNNIWDHLKPEFAPNTPVKAQKPKPVVIYVKRTPEPVQQNWPSFPVYEAHSIKSEESKTINTIINKNKNKSKVSVDKDKNDKQNDNKVIKTKLPVGLSSFFLGGMRGISGRHWQMPSSLVTQVEFMPNDSIDIDLQKPRTYVKPGVYFDDDNDFYNYNVIKVDK